MASNDRPVVLFLCTANACRSQMAEALATARWGHVCDVYSAGVKPGTHVDPYALRVLDELGIDHSKAFNKTIATAQALFGNKKCALVVTLCDSAAQDCPFYSKTRKFIHTPFRDPPKEARDAGVDGEAALAVYREVRDEIKTFVDTLPELVPELAGVPTREEAAASNSPSERAIAVRAPATATDALCEDITAALQLPTATGHEHGQPSIGFFERWLTLFVLACMVIGALIGYYEPAVSKALEKASFAGINAVVAVLLWIMIIPMLVQIDFASLKAVKDAPGAIALTSVLNYLVKPFTMAGLGHLFMRVLYVNVIPDVDLRDSYIAGLILLAGAPCTAMVFVWSLLMGGDGAYTLVQVAFNDVLMLFLFVPICALLIGVSNIPLPWLTIIYSVLLFIVAPVCLSAALRWYVIRHHGETYLNERVVKPMKPASMVALLATLILIFIFQGQVIGQRPLHIVLLAVPIIIQCVTIWAICYAVGWTTCIPHERTGPASLIATSNFFELAVAVAISVYGLDSGAALATVVGVLVEVPVMLALVKACNYMKPKLQARCEACAVVCPQPAALGSRLASASCCRSPQQS